MTNTMPGLAMAGGKLMHGRLRNMSASEITRQTAGVAWQHDAVSDARVRVLAYVDGQLRAIPDAADGGVDLNNVGSGDSSAQFVLVGEFENPMPRQIDPFGQNAYLSWSPSTSPDCVAYRVYSSEGLLDTINTIAVIERIQSLPDSGSGSGTITVWGRVPDFHGTADGILSIIAPGEALWICPGTSDESIEFSAGTVTTLYPGFSIVFNNDPSAYNPGDTWNIHIGPECHYITDTLEPNTHQFNVAAVDAAGNESTPVVASQSIFIPLIPDPVEPEFDLSGSTLNVSWQLPANADGVRIYTNFNPHTNQFEPYVCTDGLPYAIATDSWSFSPPAGLEGRLLFYLRPYNANAERDDGLLNGFSFPPEPGDVGVNIAPPTGVTATPTTGGTWKLEWDYRLFSGSQATEFNIYRHGSDEPIDYNTDLLITVPMSEGVGLPVIHFTYHHPTPEVGTIRLAVRTSNGTIETTNTDYVTLTPDATPPIFIGPVTGGPA